jgi:hypothetical protein
LVLVDSSMLGRRGASTVGGDCAADGGSGSTLRGTGGSTLAGAECDSIVAVLGPPPVATAGAGA